MQICPFDPSSYTFGLITLHLYRELLALRFPTVFYLFGMTGIAAATASLFATTLIGDELGRAFCLGVFSAGLLGAVVLFAIAKYAEVMEERRTEHAIRESQNALAAIIDAVPAIVSAKDRDGRFVFMNKYQADLLGIEATLAAGRTRSELLGDSVPALDRAEEQVLAHGNSVHGAEEHVFDADGVEHTFLTTRVPLQDANGSRHQVASISLDVTANRRVEAALAESEERHRTLVQNAPFCIFEIDLTGSLLSVNPAGARMIGASGEDSALGRPLVDFVTTKDRDEVTRALSRTRKGEPQQLQFEVEHSGGQSVLASSFIPLRDSHGEVIKVMGVMQDITNALLMADRLTYHASFDSLTGLVNRREFEQRLDRVLKTAREDASEHALCYLDLDQFKVINDTCGHVAGDELLRQLAVLLKERIRKRDTLARLGGDEFGALMEHCTLAQAERIADHLRRGIEAFRFVWEDKSFNIGVSIGVVAITQASEGITGVLRAADSACYAAKDGGRNRVHVYQQDDSDLLRWHGEMQWVNRIQSALDEDRFKLYYQPISDLSGRGQHGAHYEVLLRMEEHGETISPNAFLPSAERYNLATRIDRWVIATTFDWLRSHPRHLADLHLCCINLSGHSVVNEEFLQFVFTEFNKGVVEPHHICFEITETAAIANLTSATRFIRALNALGCRFALDDFGSGLSSFAYLKTLPVDFLKIDGFFVKDIVDNPLDFAMVKSINEIGQVMEKKTIAEFAETELIVDKLRELKVDYSQGYYSGHARPMGELLH